jgi:hypothetical protein
MAQRATEKSYFTFVKGLNTEASPFTFPENASYDEANMELLTNGARRRRLGIDYESGYVETALAVDDTLQAITQFEWRDAGGNSAHNFIVVQTGRYIRFFANDTILSDGAHSTVIDLSTYKVSTATQAEQNAAPCSMSSGKGYLFITNLYTDPIYISYTPSTDTITANTFICRMREFNRIDDSLEINETPSTLSDEHRFNLLNQGWTDANISAYLTAKGSYPSNAHIMAHGWLVTGATGVRTFSAAEVDKYELGSSPAPNGSLVTNLFNTTLIYDSNNSVKNTTIAYNGTTTVTVTTTTAHGRTTGDEVTLSDTSFSYLNVALDPLTGTWDGTYTVTVTNTTVYTITVAVPTDYNSTYATTTTGYTNTHSLTNPLGVAEDFRFIATAFYAGRVWFAGVPSNTLNSRIFYSQVLQDENKIGRFHQEADPTAEEDSALVDTDGGYLTIPDMGQVQRMELFGSKLMLFTSNGVYSIGGGAEDYFKATSFTVRKVIDLSVTSPRSVVTVDGGILSFAKQGIYRYAEDPQSGLIVGQSLSENTIQTLFSLIPEACLSYVVGAYDDTYKRAVWTYSLDADYPQRHSRVLTLDLRLGAFSIYTVPATATTFMSGGVPIRVVTTKDKKLKFFTVTTTGTKITYSDFTNTDWLDWYTADSTGTDAAAYLLTGHELVGDVMRKKQVPYLFLYFKRSETQWISSGGSSATLDPPSSCMVQAWWDFADSTAGNKIGTAFQGYRHNRVQIAPNSLPATFDPGYTIVTTKNKLRGVGKAIQLKFYTQTGYDMYLYGWSTTLTGYTEV